MQLSLKLQASRKIICKGHYVGGKNFWSYTCYNECSIKEMVHLNSLHKIEDLDTCGVI
jgi:hypothetical protein